MFARKQEKRGGDAGSKLLPAETGAPEPFPPSGDFKSADLAHPVRTLSLTSEGGCICLGEKIIGDLKIYI